MAAIYHEKLDVTIDVAESAVPVLMISGWVPVDGKAQPLPAEPVEAVNEEQDKAEAKSTTTTKRAAR